MMKNLKLFGLLLIVCLLMTGCFEEKVEEKTPEEKVIQAEMISYADLNKIVNDFDNYFNTDVIDVRSIEEYEEGHIKEAINIPYEDLYDIIISYDREIIIYGDTSTKSKQAAKDLIGLGYKNVKYIAGVNNWTYELVD